MKNRSNLLWVICLVIVIGLGCGTPIEVVYDRTQPAAPTARQSGCEPSTQEDFLPNNNRVRVRLCADRKRIYSFTETLPLRRTTYVVQSFEDASMLNLAYAEVITYQYNEANSLGDEDRAFFESVVGTRTSTVRDPGIEIFTEADREEPLMIRFYIAPDDESVQRLNQLLGIQ